MTRTRPVPLRAAAKILPILLGFAVVSTAFSVVVPLFEAPDEPSHVGMVRFIQTQRALPVQRPPNDFPAGQQGSQPPLYYALGALVLGLAPAPGPAPTLDDQNPHVTFARTRLPRDNRNLYAHRPSAGFPAQGDVPGIQLVRLLSVALGCATVLLTFLSARQLFPDRPLVSVLAPALVAFNPQFVYLSGVVNSDDGIAAAGALVLWLLLRCVTSGWATARTVALGLALGAALLTKLSALTLVPLIAAGLLGDFAVHRAGRLLSGRALLVAAPALAVAGWWFVRNQFLYGDPLGWNAMLAAVANMERRPPLDILEATRVLWKARGSYWGAFGWTNLFFDDQVYRILDLALGLALAGLLVGLARSLLRRPEPRRLLALALLALWPLVVLAGLIRWVQVNEAAHQGRLLFPAASAVGLLLALGFDELRRLLSNRFGSAAGPGWGGVKSRHRTADAGRWHGAAWGGSAGVSAAVALLGVALNLAVLQGEIVPVYYPTFEDGARDGVTSVLRFGDDVELVEYRVSPRSLEAGGVLDVELVWRALRPVARNWSVALDVLDDDQTPLAEVRSWPQGGRAPTAIWQPGRLVRDRYTLVPAWTGRDPQLATVWLGLYDALAHGGPQLPVWGRDGQPLGDRAALQTVKLRPTEQVRSTPTVLVGARFGEVVDLLGYDVAREPDRLRLTLYWRSVTVLAESYTVFVHVADAEGRPLAQHDGLPRQGRYPTTAWEPGEVVRDPHEVDLRGIPAGTYRVRLGLYLLANGRRLTIHSSEPMQPDDGALDLFGLSLPERPAR